MALTGTAQAAGPPTDLTVGDQARPLNVEGTPQFGWMPASSKGNDVQTAYQLTVAKGASTVWDSGKVASSAQSYVPYGGPALENGEAYTWSVKTWDRDGEASPAATAAIRDRPDRPGLVGRAVDPPRHHAATTPPTTTRSRASGSRR